jgi:hypothetical protein
MKKALVYIKEIKGNLVGKVAMGMEASEMDKWTHHHVSSGSALKIEVPVELESIPEGQLTGVLVPVQAESWDDGTNIVFTEPADLTGWTYLPSVPEHYEIQKGAGFIAYDKEQRINEAYDLMTLNIYTEMKNVYLTNKADSATATYLTWMSMKTNPISFSTAGLVSKYNVGTISIGDPLNTDALVLAYANDLMALSENYAVFREQAIQTYIGTKASIEAE